LTKHDKIMDSSVPAIHVEYLEAIKAASTLKARL
jgi:hypothetical protein